MVISCASFKGGVAKSTTAVHLAAYLQQKAPTLLIDGDPNRSVSEWASAGKLPFKVVDDRQSALHIPKYKHIVIDTKARPEPEDLRSIALGCHLLVIPSTPDPLSLKAMMLTIQALRNIGTDRYRVLLTIIPPKPSRDAEEARELLKQNGIPVFESGVRRLVAFQRAALEGTTVEQVDRNNLGWQDYVAIGQQVEEISTRIAE